MKFELIFVGKTREKFLQQGIETYLGKLNHYISAEIVTVPVAKSRDQKNEESNTIMKRIASNEVMVLLDEKGKRFTSVDLSVEIQKWMNQSVKKIVFVTGGAYGVNDLAKRRANYVWSLSKLTFTHEMVRLILLEQLYRAMTIIKGEAYHHE